MDYILVNSGWDENMTHERWERWEGRSDGGRGAGTQHIIPDTQQLEPAQGDKKATDGQILELLEIYSLHNIALTSASQPD